MLQIFSTIIPNLPLILSISHPSPLPHPPLIKPEPVPDSASYLLNTTTAATTTSQKQKNKPEKFIIEQQQKKQREKKNVERSERRRTESSPWKGLRGPTTSSALGLRWNQALVLLQSPHRWVHCDPTFPLRHRCHRHRSQEDVRRWPLRWRWYPWYRLGLRWHDLHPGLLHRWHLRFFFLYFLFLFLKKGKKKEEDRRRSTSIIWWVFVLIFVLLL